MLYCLAHRIPRQGSKRCFTKMTGYINVSECYTLPPIAQVVLLQ